MTLAFTKTPLDNQTADVIAVFIHQDPTIFKKEIASLARKLGVHISPVDSGDFTGSRGETALLYTRKGSRNRRFLLVGLGERAKADLELFRRSGAIASKRARALKARSLAFILPTSPIRFSDLVTSLAEGALLALYRFDKYIAKKTDSPPDLDHLELCTDSSARVKEGQKAVRRAEIICTATTLARDLGNAPGLEIYPETLAEAAKASAEQNGFEISILDEREIQELGMGGVIGVSRGSSRPPRFIILEYGDKGKPPVVLVGKGVTFDTGGISIKPSGGMAEMKMDMSGAAAVIGTVQAVSQLKLPVHVIGLIPSVENMPGGNSIRPGDILRHLNGKTSEVDNTDAEGRLILADALAFAERYSPAAVIDLATLTGACVVALGHHATGMMGNDPALMKKLDFAGARTHERVWQLPLFEEYEKQIKSDVADVKNTGGRWAGAITAGLFLKKFVGTYKWVHLDIAGTAIMEENGEYTQKGASGVGVRLLTEFLSRWR